MTIPTGPSAPLSRAEFTALATIAKARKENLRAMFQDSQMVYGKMSAAGSAKSVLSAGKKVYSSARQLAGIGAAAGGAAKASGLRAQAAQLVLEAVGVHQLADLIAVITREAVESLVKEMIPYVGIIPPSIFARCGRATRGSTVRRRSTRPSSTSARSSARTSSRTRRPPWCSVSSSPTSGSPAGWTGSSCSRSSGSG